MEEFQRKKEVARRIEWGRTGYRGYVGRIERTEEDGTGGSV